MSEDESRRILEASFTASDLQGFATIEREQLAARAFRTAVQGYTDGDPDTAARALEQHSTNNTHPDQAAQDLCLVGIDLTAELLADETWCDDPDCPGAHRISADDAPTIWSRTAAQLVNHAVDREFSAVNDTLTLLHSAGGRDMVLVLAMALSETHVVLSRAIHEQ